MTGLLLAAFFLASAGPSGELDPAREAAQEAPRIRDGGFRLSAGAGGSGFGLVGATRLLVVLPGTSWRVGVQGTAMAEMSLSKHPNENVGSFHVVAARELVPSGPNSVLVFGGLGMASLERRGRYLETVESESFGSSDDEHYESIKDDLPSVLAGVDLGASLRRILGVSLQIGGELGAANTVYMLAQADIGAW
jgi:hypothetical protein